MSQVSPCGMDTRDRSRVLTVTLNSPNCPMAGDRDIPATLGMGRSERPELGSPQGVTIGIWGPTPPAGAPGPSWGQIPSFPSPVPRFPQRGWLTSVTQRVSPMGTGVATVSHPSWPPAWLRTLAKHTGARREWLGCVPRLGTHLSPRGHIASQSGGRQDPQKSLSRAWHRPFLSFSPPWGLQRCHGVGVGLSRVSPVLCHLWAMSPRCSWASSRD